MRQEDLASRPPCSRWISTLPGWRMIIAAPGVWQRGWPRCRHRTQHGEVQTNMVFPCA